MKAHRLLNAHTPLCRCLSATFASLLLAHSAQAATFTYNRSTAGTDH
jgi:hypothetical protein